VGLAALSDLGPLLSASRRPMVRGNLPPPQCIARSILRSGTVILNPLFASL